MIQSTVRQRLDKIIVARGLAPSRSQAESMIKLGDVFVNAQPVQKPGFLVTPDDRITLSRTENYVSRAGRKLASVAAALDVQFDGKVVLDIGSSTGGFTDYALRHGAKKVIAVDVGTDQLHPRLRGHARIELHEKTDIRHFYTDDSIDLIVGDVSFISLRDILPHVAKNLMQPQTILVAMVKPQFEAGRQVAHKGVIKNDTIRRRILTHFEEWARRYFVVLAKQDSRVAGAKGNLERFYKLRRVPHRER